ncbi:cache domain-containing protein [Clostridium cylindrosporum]|nr:cache domain-containing protein [Clostridium cylindrosporum]
MQKNMFECLLNDFKYDLIQFSTDNDIISMDKSKISKRIDFIKYYKSDYKDIIVINNKKEILNGYVGDVKEYMYSEHVLEALKGKPSISDAISIEGKWYVDFVSPIINGEKQIGIISLRISLEEISDHLRFENQDGSMEVYIVDKEGYYLTSGKGNMRKIGENNINISELKTNIDYAPRTHYRNYDGDNVYGSYYNLSFGEWTLVVESLQDRKSLNMITVISMVIGVFVQFLMNKILNMSHRFWERYDKYLLK